MPLKKHRPKAKTRRRAPPATRPTTEPWTPGSTDHLFDASIVFSGDRDDGPPPGRQPHGDDLFDRSTVFGSEL